MVAVQLATLAGCTSIDFDYPRDASTAIAETTHTNLGSNTQI
jgi:hypothetical protein